jgi:sugar phosphate isomerase/epimerase
MNRRTFLSGAAAAAATSPQAGAKPPTNAKFGVDLFSIRSSGWSPFEYLDYCAKWKADVVHFSEVRFLGGLEAAHVKKVGEYASNLGIELEIGMSSICPSSGRFDAKEGTAEQQLERMIDSAKIAGSKIVRAYLGTMADRKGPIPIEGHIENTAKALRNVRSRAMDSDVKIAVENHAGDMQGRELKMLIELAGKDFVGACVDSGNPLWVIEDPHVTLEVLAPYALTSHVRDSRVWRTEKGAAVRWVRTGEGNVRIDEWIRKFAEQCPGLAITQEVIVTGPRDFNFLEPSFWEGYENVPAANFSRFLALAEAGKPDSTPYKGPGKEERAEAERADLEASMSHVKKILGA